MAVNIEQVIAAGFKLCEYHILDSNGYPAGTTGSVAAGSIAGAGTVLGVQSANIAIPEPDRVSIPGDDTSLGKFQFDSTDTPEFNIDVGVEDLALEAAMQSMLVTSEGDIQVGVLQPNAPVYKDILLMFTSNAKSYAAASRGTSNILTYVVPKVNAQPLGRVAFEGRQGAAFRYACVANFSTTFGTGATFQTALNGTESMTVTPMTSENQLTMDRLTGNGAATSFTLRKKPAGTTFAKVRITVNGVRLLSGFTVTPATKNITFSVAPASNAVVIILYEWIPS